MCIFVCTIPTYQLSVNYYAGQISESFYYWQPSICDTVTYGAGLGCKMGGVGNRRAIGGQSVGIPGGGGGLSWCGTGTLSGSGTGGLYG